MPLSDKHKRHFEILVDRALKREERLRRMRLSSNIVPVSNDVKWLKIFDDLKSQLERNTTCNIKLLKQKEPWEYRNILSSVFEVSYFDGFDGPINYSEIEWIMFNSSVVPEFEFNVDMEVGKGFIVIYGYRVNNS